VFMVIDGFPQEQFVKYRFHVRSWEVKRDVANGTNSRLLTLKDMRRGFRPPW